MTFATMEEKLAALFLPALTNVFLKFIRFNTCSGSTNRYEVVKIFKNLHLFSNILPVLLSKGKEPGIIIKY